MLIFVVQRDLHITPPQTRLLVKAIMSFEKDFINKLIIGTKKLEKEK